MKEITQVSDFYTQTTNRLHLSLGQVLGLTLSIYTEHVAQVLSQDSQTFIAFETHTKTE